MAGGGAGESDHNTSFSVKVKRPVLRQQPPGSHGGGDDDDPSNDGKGCHRVLIYIVLDPRPHEKRQREEAHEQRHDLSLEPRETFSGVPGAGAVFCDKITHRMTRSLEAPIRRD